MTETRYHVSRNGTLSKCSATKRACPLGGEHFSQKRYEQMVAENDPRTLKAAKKTAIPNSKPSVESSFHIAKMTTPSGQFPKTSSVAVLDQKDVEDMIPADLDYGTPHEEEPTLIAVRPARVAQTESHSARLIRKDPMFIDGYARNVECVCGWLRHGPDRPCSACSRRGEANIKGYRVVKKDEILLDSKAAVKTRFWYHSTTREDWASSVKDADIPVHLGNKTTAKARAEHLSDDTGAKTYYVYKMILNPFARIADNICPDLTNDWSETMEKYEQNADGDFVRYVNNYENSGTVSLFGNPNKFIILGKTAHRIP